MKKRKSIVLLALILLGTTIFPNLSFASFNSDYIYEQELSINDEFDNANSKIQERSIPSWISKKAIKAAIKPSNQRKVVNLVGRYVGGDMAVKVGKYYDKIAEALKPLLKWAEIPAQAVEDSIYRNLYNFGVSSAEARSIGHEVKTIIDLVI